MSTPDYPKINTLSDWYGVKDDYPAITILADACAGNADDSVPEAVRAWREVARLRQWKAEAEEVLAAWEGVWMIAGQPWRRGETQAQAVAREVQRLRSEVAAWMNGVADVVEPLGYDRGAACGLQGLKAEAARAGKALRALIVSVWTPTAALPLWVSAAVAEEDQEGGKSEEG